MNAKGRLNFRRPFFNGFSSKADFQMFARLRQSADAWRFQAWPRGMRQYGRQRGMILICCLRRFDFLFGYGMIAEINTS